MVICVRPASPEHADGEKKQMRIVRVSLGAVAVTAVLAVGPAHAADKAGAADVAKLYQEQCARCHGASGKGDGDDGIYYTTKPTDFTAPAPTPKRTDDFLAAVISNGGPSKGLSVDMPAFKLSPAEVKGLVAMIRQFSAVKAPAKAK
jgi:mono/diheme cytochrome c family protein